MRARGVLQITAVRLPLTVVNWGSIVSDRITLSRMSSRLRFTAALELLEAPSPVQRSEALDQLTAVLQELNWQLNGATELSAKKLIQALRNRLSDSNWLAPPAPWGTQALP